MNRKGFKASDCWSMSSEVPHMSFIPGSYIKLMYPAQYLNEINCSGLSLTKLQLKIECSVMDLRNLYPADGVCNGTKGIVKRMSLCVIEIKLISEEH